MSKIMQGRRFLVLLVSLLTLLLVFPIVGQTDKGQLIMSFFYIFILLATVYELREVKVNLALFSMLAIVYILLDVIDLMHDSEILQIIKMSVFLIYCSIAIFLLFSEVFKSKVVTRDIIFGGICIYLLIGIGFASVYQYIAAYSEGAFANSSGDAMTPFDYIYFSIITLTTVGFGDIVPTTQVARSVVLLESITGILYLATTISKLMSRMRI